MSENFLLDGMRGYKFVRDIKREDMLDANNEADRQARLGIMRSADERANAGAVREQTTFEQSQEDRTATRNLAATKNDAVLERLRGPQSQQAQPRDDVYAGMANALDSMGIKTGTPEFQSALAKVKPLIDNPDEAGKGLALSEGISKYLDSGKLPPGKMWTEYINTVGKSELAARGGDDGLTRSVKDMIPNQSGDGFHFNLLVSTPDGKSYEAPATEGGSADPNDKVVQNFPMEKMLHWFAGSRASLIAIIEAEKAAGKTDTLDAYQKYAQGKVAKADAVEDAVTQYKAVEKVKPSYYSSTLKREVSAEEYEKLPEAQKATFTPTAALDREDKAADRAQKNAVSAAQMAFYGARVDNLESKTHGKGNGLTPSQTAERVKSANAMLGAIQKRLDNPKTRGGVTDVDVDSLNAARELANLPPLVLSEKSTERGFGLLPDKKTKVLEVDGGVEPGGAGSGAPSGVGKATGTRSEVAATIQAMNPGPEKTEAIRQHQEQVKAGNKTFTIALDGKDGGNNQAAQAPAAAKVNSALEESIARHTAKTQEMPIRSVHGSVKVPEKQPEEKSNNSAESGKKGLGITPKTDTVSEAGSPKAEPAPGLVKEFSTRNASSKAKRLLAMESVGRELSKEDKAFLEEAINAGLVKREAKQEAPLTRR